MTSPLVDVVIAVHSSTRPIARAVRSALESTTPVRVTVVAHNIDPAAIEANLGPLLDDDRVRLLPLADGIASPAGPFNVGIEHASAPFFAVMGSDDRFEAGALDSWIDLQHRTSAAMVVARVLHEGGANDATPLVRRSRPRLLDPVADRLPYRSAPLGLISTARFGDLRFTEGLPSGEDIAFVNAIWFSGHAVAFDREGPAYLVSADAVDRVTSAPRPVAEDFRFLDDVVGSPWFAGLTRAAREVLAVKLLRMNVLDAIVNRAATPWTPHEAAALAEVIDRIITLSPGVTRLLSRVDRDVIDSARSRAGDPAELTRRLARRWELRHPAAVLPRNALLALHRQGPFRWLYASLRASSPVARQL